MKKLLAVLVPVLVLSTGLLCALIFTVKPPHYQSETVMSKPTMADSSDDGENIEEETESADTDSDEDSDEDSNEDTSAEGTDEITDEDLNYEEEYEVEESVPDNNNNKNNSNTSSDNGGVSSSNVRRVAHVRDKTPATADLEIPPQYILCGAFLFLGFAMLIVSALREERLRRSKVELESKMLASHVNFRRNYLFDEK